MTAYYGGIGANTCPFSDSGFKVLVAPHNVASWVYDICKDRAGSDKNIVFTNYACVQGNIVLYFHIIANADTRRDDYILADIAVFADPAIGHNMAEMPDSGA
jgi:hypothetical protein